MVLLITDSFLKLQKADRGGYFIPQISVLDNEQIHDFEVHWNTDLPMSESILPIKEKILSYKKKVTILAHGKGGIDALECLIQFPELQSKVAKLVTMQSPMWGTPLADFMTGHPFMGIATKAICKFDSAMFKAIEEMSELNRQVYMIVNKEKIQSLMKNVVVMSVGSSVDFSFGDVSKLMKKAHALVTKHAGSNDGIVPLKSTRIANEEHLDLENVTHLSSVMPTMAITSEIEDLMKQIIKPAKPSKLAAHPAKFPWGQSEAHSAPKLGRPYQLEIS